MFTTNEENWMMRNNEPKDYVTVYYHFPAKHKVEFRGFPNWAHYTQQKIKACVCPKNKDSSSKPIGLVNILKGSRKKIWKKTMLETGEQAPRRSHMAYSLSHSY